MRPSLSTSLLCLSLAAPMAAFAQNAVWIQVEAESSLNEAQERAQFYARSQQNVVGYSLRSGWFGIALGPYSRDDAETLLAQLKARGAVPSDSYIELGRSYRNQFYPVGQGAPTEAQPLPGAVTPAPAATPAAPAPEADETKAEAVASERLLSRDQKADLQVALKWAGVYNSGIDGLYGKGTRRAMAAWQEQQSLPVTGVLTTQQRQDLLRAYNAILDGMDLQLIQDDAAGIRMQIPTGVVGFERYDPPFARFEGSGDLPAKVLMISQEGDRSTLAGLYEVMQTLQIVPREGERTLKKDRFLLEGVSDSLHSITEARLIKGQIKGFTLVWPAGDDARRRRVLEEMRKSYERIDGVLDPVLISPGSAQATDLVSGLEIRKPRLSRSGFYINDSGQVLTTQEAVSDCGKITLDGDHDATLALSDDSGFAVLTPVETLAPPAVATFLNGTARLRGRVALAGFPYDGALSTAALTFGTLADIKGLTGAPEQDVLSLRARPSESGGPVFDNTGQVIGMLMPKSSPDGKQLPADVAYTLDSGTLIAQLGAAGVTVTTNDAVGYVTEEQITLDASGMTVLVRCWE